MGNCVICGASLAGKRGGARTCSDACRSKAYYNRKMADKRWKDCNLDMFDSQDLKRLGRISYDAAECVLKIANVQGREQARLVIDAMCSLLTNAGVNWQNE